MKSAPGTIHRTAQLRAVFIDIILLLMRKADKHIKNSYHIICNNVSCAVYIDIEQNINAKENVIMRKLEELIQDEAFRKEMGACTDLKQIVELFAKEGISVTEAELKQTMAEVQSQMGEELGEEALDHVAGGIAVATCGAYLLWGAGTCFVSAAYKCWAAYRFR